MTDQQRKKLDRVGVMNDTKWDELRHAMYALGTNSPRFRIKDVAAESSSDWDGEWYYHFRLLPYSKIEWVELRVTSSAQRVIIRQRLREIRVPGEETSEGFRILGWIQSGTAVGYIG